MPPQTLLACACPGRIGGRKMQPPIFQLYLVELEHKVLREPILVALHLLVEALRAYPIETGEI